MSIEGEEPVKKRQRVSKACQQCRRKKIKCIGEPPACNNCQVQGLTCQYLESKKKRGPPKGYIEAIEGRLQRLEALIGKCVQEDDPRAQALWEELNSPLETSSGQLVRPRPIFATQHDDSAMSMQHLHDDDHHHQNSSDHDDLQAASSSSPRQEPSSPSQSASQHHPQDASMDDDNDHAMDDKQQGGMGGIGGGKGGKARVKHEAVDDDPYDASSSSGALEDNLSIDDAGQLRYYGKSSGLDVLWNKRNLKNQMLSLSSFHFHARRTLDHGTDVDPTALPPADLSEHLIELYFSNFYPWLPALHKDSFLERLASKDNRPPLLLLNCLYAAGSLLTTDLRVRSDPANPETAGDIFKERFHLLMDNEWDNFNVHTVQALVLMSAVQNGSLNSVRGWLYAGLAIRMAQNLGLHRNSDNWQLTAVEKEERKRAFYCCFMADRLSSAMHGRTPLMDERDVDAALPSHVDERHDVGVDMDLDGFHHLIKLCVLLGDVLRDLYTVRGRNQLSMMTCPDSVVANLDRRLNKWMAQLPQGMRYRPPNSRLAEKAPCPSLQLCQIHMMFYTTLILVHRPFIPGSSSTTAPSIFPSASICSFAANKILDITLSLQDAGNLKGCNNYTLYFMFTAGIIFLYNARASDSSFALEAKISVNKIMKAMDVLETTWSTSARHCNILGALAGLRDIELKNVDQSYSRLQQLQPNKHKNKQSKASMAIAVPNSPENDQDQWNYASTSTSSPSAPAPPLQKQQQQHKHDTLSPIMLTNVDRLHQKHHQHPSQSQHQHQHQHQNPQQQQQQQQPLQEQSRSSPASASSISPTWAARTARLDEKYGNYYLGQPLIEAVSLQHPHQQPQQHQQQQQHDQLQEEPQPQGEEQLAMPQDQMQEHQPPLPSLPDTHDGLLISTLSPPIQAFLRGMDDDRPRADHDIIQQLLSSHPMAPDFLSNSPVPFDPHASAFWDLPSSVDMREWDNYMALQQAQKGRDDTTAATPASPPPPETSNGR